MSSSHRLASPRPFAILDLIEASMPAAVLFLYIASPRPSLPRPSLPRLYRDTAPPFAEVLLHWRAAGGIRDGVAALRPQWSFSTDALPPESSAVLLPPHQRRIRALMAAAYGRSLRQPACTLTVNQLPPLAFSTCRTRGTLLKLFLRRLVSTSRVLFFYL
jgi:hypothetical protein